MMVGHDGELHPSNLQFYFVSTEQQFESAKLGMWLFLATEILLFGGMFVAYGIFRVLYPELYEQASMQLDTTLGAFNTLVLLLSSLTMAWAIRAAQMDNRKLLIQMLSATIVLAGFFLVVKYFEYEHKYHLGILPGEAFVLEEGTPRVEDLVEGVPATPLITFGEESEGGDGGGDAAPAGETGSAEATPAAASAAPAGDAAHSDDHGEYAREGEIFSNRRAGIFFGIYYMMTGVHAIHIIIGMIAIGFLVYYSWKGKYSSVYYTPVENVGLYWHIVDVIWIFVFPLMYLI
ncbi:MAG: cytochrome c oxidase subunit 3 [Bacteroidota bacterium]